MIFGLMFLLFGGSILLGAGVIFGYVGTKIFKKLNKAAAFIIGFFGSLIILCGVLYLFFLVTVDIINKSCNL
jgi:hypothetical protein